jgi:hypothetical protein
MQCHTEEMGSTASDGRHSSDTCCKHRLHMSPKHAPPPVSPCAADRSLVRSSELGPYLNLHCGGKMHALKPLPAVLPYWQYTQDVLQARPQPHSCYHLACYLPVQNSGSTLCATTVTITHIPARCTQQCVLLIQQDSGPEALGEPT